MKLELLGEQVIRIAMECARRGGVHEDHVDDCAMDFMHRKFAPDDLFKAARKGEEVQKLTKTAERYVESYLRKLRPRANREVSLTGADGTEANGPCRHLISRLPTPEEVTLRQQIWDYLEEALNWLTAAQVELYRASFEQDERAVDLKEARGVSADAIRHARMRLRLRLRKLLNAAGMDLDASTQLLNELDRLRCRD